MSLRRWMSIVEGRRGLLGEEVVGVVRKSVDWRSWARGCAEMLSASRVSRKASSEKSSVLVLAPEARRLFFLGGSFANGFAQSGVGFRRSNWRRRRLV